MNNAISASGSTKHFSVPSDVCDLASLNEWLASLPAPQRDVTPDDFVATDDSRWCAFGWGRAVTREALQDRPTEARDEAQREVMQTLAFLLMGFIAASPEGVVWRARPEMEWRTDAVTDNAIVVVYVRIGRDPAHAEKARAA